VRRVRLGDWTTRTGNNVVAFYIPGAMFPEPAVMLAWDREPPLSRDDQADYDTVILPAIVARVAEYTEQLGRRLVVRL
jgi:hypothetical protein